jgi:L-aminopeptidase/D-esterase-like protein
LLVSALVAVNAWGGVRALGDTELDESWPPPSDPFTNTTLSLIVTNAKLDKAGCFHVAQGGSDGMASATAPAHASADGDAVVAVATGVVEAPVDQVRFLAHRAVELAIRGLAGPAF